MSLEAIDPDHPNMICAVSVSEVQGARVRLHFDGFSESYDFWEDINGGNIFPVGYAAENGQRLHPPKGFEKRFEWNKYFQKNKHLKAAPNDSFEERYSASSGDTSGWQIGMKLEAVDKANANPGSSYVGPGVATVANILEDRVLIHFDGWEQEYDYWVSNPRTSPYLHPIGWCRRNGMQLNAPKDFSEEQQGSFEWDDYLNATGSCPVPESAFGDEKEIIYQSKFELGMKLEAVDKRNPVLIRVASVAEVSGRQIRIHYDGWPDEYDVWMEDNSPHLHPPSYCSRTRHYLMPPLSKCRH